MVHEFPGLSSRKVLSPEFRRTHPFGCFLSVKDLPIAQEGSFRVSDICLISSERVVLG